MPSGPHTGKRLRRPWLTDLGAPELNCNPYYKTFDPASERFDLVVYGRGCRDSKVAGSTLRSGFSTAN